MTKSKTKIFCHNVGSNVSFDRALTCLAFESFGSRSRGNFCGYCKHSQTGDEDEMTVDLDAVFGE